MQKPICRSCQRFYRPKKNSFPYIEAMPVGDTRPLSGTAEPENWKPYKLWVGDLWSCEGCGHEIVIGALAPVSEHYRPDFQAQVARCKPTLTVNDC